MQRTPVAAVDSLHAVALSDGRAGNIVQADALLAALLPGSVPAHVALHPSPAARLLSPRRYPLLSRPFGDAFAGLLDAPPALAIGCGRQAALATRLLRERGTRVVQVLDPRLPARYWDVLVVPGHDAARGDNVLTTLGSLNPVDDAWLARARADHPALGLLPQPRTAVLLGGSSRHVRFDRMSFEVLAARLEVVLARNGGSVLLTTSRRTPRELRRAVRHRYDETPGIAWTGPDDGANPYRGLLAWADRIVCSPDSVNMVSEACATRAPVFVFDPGRARGRPRRFLDALLARGRIRPMDRSLSPFASEPLRETARIAEELRVRFGLPGQP